MEKKNESHTSKNNTKKIKKRVYLNKKPKYTKTDIKVKYIFYIVLVLLLIACGIFMGKEFTIIAAFGVLIILGITTLINRSHKRGKLILTLILIFLLALGIAGLCVCGYFMYYIKQQADPKFKISNLNTSEITILYDKDGQEIIRLGSERREKITYDELPEVLVDAIVATEDSRFFQHNGFDAARFAKAAFGQVLGHSDAGGASTLSMQVVKNSFTDAKADSGVSGIIRKAEDIYLSIFRLEKTYTKEQIIEFYVNNHFLGGNIYGVEEASEVYFGKKVSELNLAEASILAGMFKSPNLYRPNVNPINATNRRKTVLALMRKHGYITKEEEKIANSIPVESLTVEARVEDDSPYQGYIDTVADEVIEKYGVDPYSTSLLIYTNLDRSRQDAVNKVLSGEAYSWKDDRVQSGIAVLDSATGKIQAIGNGRNRGNLKKSYNYATQLKRQPGSTAKPLFDYGPGIEFNNWSTYGYNDGNNNYKLFVDGPYSYSNGRSIKNWDGGYYGSISLRTALSASRNIPALKAFQMVDRQNIINFVTALGIEPEIENGSIHEAHSIGAFTGVSPLKMAGAYAAFSNGGNYNEPYSVSKITFRSSGQTIEHEDNPVRVMSDATAYMIASVLQDVVMNAGGTPPNVALKTGTTNYDDKTMNSYNMPYDAIRDSWVVGFSSRTTIGMWYGYDSLEDYKENNQYILHNIPATIAKDKLFRALIETGAMEADRAPFNMPDSVVKLPIYAGSNPAIVAGGDYNGVVYEYFKKDFQPSNSASKEQEILSGVAPSNLKVSYNSTSHVVSLSWNAAKVTQNPAYGEFGYNIYLNDNLIGWTNDIAFSFQTASPCGTYKLVGTYQSYSGIQTSPATVSFNEDSVCKKEEEKPQPEPEPTPSTNCPSIHEKGSCIANDDCIWTNSEGKTGDEDKTENSSTNGTCSNKE